MRPHVKPRIQLCPTCGHMRTNHPGANIYQCPVPKDVTDAIRQFARQHGKTWKAKLCLLWESGKDPSLLHQARNLIGPRRLYKIRVS